VSGGLGSISEQTVVAYVGSEENIFKISFPTHYPNHVPHEYNLDAVSLS